MTTSVPSSYLLVVIMEQQANLHPMPQIRDLRIQMGISKIGLQLGYRTRITWLTGPF